MKMKLRPVEGGICAPEGFLAAGVYSGVKKSKKKDLALIYSTSLASAAGVFTKNKVKAAPVLTAQKVVKRGLAQAVVINSGNANACTGIQGVYDAVTMAKETAAALRIKQDHVLVSSTGIIGVPMPMQKIIGGIWTASRMVKKDLVSSAAEAILTTDLRKKEIAVSVPLGGGKKIFIGGIAKGSGMICPNMATMIGVITTDARIEPKLLQKALSESVEDSFNMLTVDNDTSTNDCVLALANGQSESVTPGKKYSAFLDALKHVCRYLAKEIARDGEGATRLVEVTLLGAKTKKDACLAAKSIAGSSLVKCAVYGADPNIGRVLSAAGYSGADFDPDRIEVKIGKMLLVKRGMPVKFDSKEASGLMKKDTVQIFVDLKLGKHSATAWGCDMTEKYIDINARYHT
jgi:glutamate N-acetyltransferase / amino-acid N-acetyltransferase